MIFQVRKGNEEDDERYTCGVFCFLEIERARKRMREWEKDRKKQR